MKLMLKEKPSFLTSRSERKRKELLRSKDKVLKEHKVKNQLKVNKASLPLRLKLRLIKKLLIKENN